ncbi:MAG: FGGY family carbohydrate kinase, partial [Clostridia bacterium]|nr:FGGY family carbohydrate kinase [Clostridia bacterium]
MKYLLGVDIGTTSLKAAVFDENANCMKSVTKDYTLEVKDDYVEFPTEKYWDLFSEALEEICAEYKIHAMSIDTQCETIIVTDENGNPLRKAIVWLDNRAEREAEAIKAHFGSETVYNVTGQPEITAGWPASKVLWVRNNKPEIFAKVKKIFMLEDWILYKLTGN